MSIDKLDKLSGNIMSSVTLKGDLGRITENLANISSQFRGHEYYQSDVTQLSVYQSIYLATGYTSNYISICSSLSFF